MFPFKAKIFFLRDSSKPNDVIVAPRKWYMVRMLPFFGGEGATYCLVLFGSEAPFVGRPLPPPTVSL